ncbi:unnamed protein product, partial [Mesorhabditis spiculigera]
MSLPALHKELLQKWGNEKDRKLDQIEAIVKNLKNALEDGDQVGKLDRNALITINRDVYEIDALVAALNGDLKAFDTAISNIMAFYASLRDDSPNKHLLVGLNLMFLLVSNRLSDFHVLLEQIDQSVQSGNPYVSTPVKMEQSLMEGAYNKIVLTEKNIPSPYYAPFVRIMMDTVRSEIASNLEKSFKQCPVRDAQTLLLLDDQASLKKFAEARKWKLEGTNYNFGDEKMETGDLHKTGLDTQRIARQAIYYAKQLEMIV